MSCASTRNSVGDLVPTPTAGIGTRRDGVSRLDISAMPPIGELGQQTSGGVPLRFKVDRWESCTSSRRTQFGWIPCIDSLDLIGMHCSTENLRNPQRPLA